MKENVVQKLLDINREFYQTFAPDFSATRMRLQPGAKRILKNVTLQSNILDLGCGNGELARSLAEMGFKGRYLGLDFSADLLEIARKGTTETGLYSFIQADLASPQWDLEVKEFANLGIDIVFAFASFHHLPGRDIHIQVLQKIHSLLKDGGCLIHSHWQFLNSVRLRKRIQPWSAAGLAPDDVEPGDYLLDWRQGGYGLRYVHLFSQDELISLAEKTGYKMVESFYSDGEGGKLGLYQVWEKVILHRGVERQDRNLAHPGPGNRFEARR